MAAATRSDIQEWEHGEATFVLAALGPAGLETLDTLIMAGIAATRAAAGEPLAIDDDTARRTYAQIGTALAGWFSAQPLFDWITAEQPDCFEDN